MWNFGTGKTVKRISANEDKTMGNDYIDEIIDDMMLDGSETADEIKKAWQMPRKSKYIRKSLSQK